MRRIMAWSQLGRHLTKLLHYPNQRTLISSSPSFPALPKPIISRPIDPAQFLRVCTVLYQQQNSPIQRLHSHLRNCEFELSHELFLQICNKFSLSWRPVYRFFEYTQSQPGFVHNSITFNKMVDVIGKSKNIELLWDVLHQMVDLRLVNDKTFRIALKALASARELGKCVEFFHLMNSKGVLYNLETLNKVVETLCDAKLVDEARHVVFKLKSWIKPSGLTYSCLIVGFCEEGDQIEASKIWNLMVDEGFEVNIDVTNKMMERFFKDNQFDQALKFFQSVNDPGLSTYRLVITWMCKRGKLSQAHVLVEEMLKRRIRADNATLAALVYGFASKGRVREACKIMEGIKDPDIAVFHGLMKGLLRLKRASEATQVFREMINRGCEPTMHTYIMLLQGHMGKRGRKGPDPVLNFNSIFVGGLVKMGRFLEATKYVERTRSGGVEVPRFDYNKFLHDFSNEEGIVMFEEIGKRLKEVGLVDLADIFIRYGEKMTTRDRRRRIVNEQ
ncbi:hypothetical protein Sjap_022682 [Stephania japonica]|uniref:Pentatricopeptide repeat-containing protein n=1 Tax=Stephania japonica TaxID=461633 RepID=A0AAP0HV72_9MAGN